MEVIPWRSGLPKPYLAADVKGELNGRSVLTLEDVRMIRKTYVRFRAGEAKAFSQRYGVAESIIRRVMAGSIWPDNEYVKPLQTQARGTLATGVKLTEADVLMIRASSESTDVLVRKFGVTQSSISQIQRRKSWKHI